MAVRVGEVPALRGSVMIKGPADAAVMGSFSVCWRVATAGVLAGAIRYQGHVCLIHLPVVEAIRRLTPSALCPGKSEMAALLEAAFDLVEQVHRLATPSFLGSAEHPRKVVRSSLALAFEGVLQLREGMGHEDLPYVSGLSPPERVLPLEPHLEEKGPLLPSFGQELYGSGPGPSRPTTAPDAGRVRRPPTRVGRYFPGQMVQMPQGRTALVPQPVPDFHWGGYPLSMPCPLAGTAEVA